MDFGIFGFWDFGIFWSDLELRRLRRKGRFLDFFGTRSSPKITLGGLGAQKGYFFYLELLGLGGAGVQKVPVEGERLFFSPRTP